MKAEILVICDKEVSYAKAILDYIEVDKKLPFQIMIFTKIEDLEIFNRKSKIELLLIAQSSYDKEIDISNVGQLFILQEENNIPDSSQIYIKKYQPVSKIIKEIRNYYYEKEPYPSKWNNKSCEIIGFYTPIKRCLQTSFALLLGQLLGANKKVLYLNMEAYSGYSRIFNQTFSVDLSDVIYSLHNQEEKFLQNFMNMVVTITGIDLIPPAFSVIDITKITLEEWTKLIQLISQYCDYDYIILDLSDSIQDLFRLLQSCTKIVTISQEEELAKAKMLQYENVLTATGYGEILEQSRKIELPYLPNHTVEINHLRYSQLVVYVQRYIQDVLDC